MNMQSKDHLNNTTLHRRHAHGQGHVVASNITSNILQLQLFNHCKHEERDLLKRSSFNLLVRVSSIRFYQVRNGVRWKLTLTFGGIITPPLSLQLQDQVQRQVQVQRDVKRGVDQWPCPRTSIMILAVILAARRIYSNSIIHS